MTSDQLILVAIVALSTLLYVTQWLPIEVVSLLTIVVLMATQVLSPADALSGFSSSATITVGAMFVLSAGIMRTGALESLTAWMTRVAKGSVQRLMVLIGITTPLISGFTNNTPQVAMMIPVLLSLGKRLSIAPSKLLLPMAYLASLGGTIALIGTSTNILVDGLYRDLGGPGLSMFEFTPAGLLYSAVGVVYILLMGPRLLPDRAPLSGLASQREGGSYITEILVPEASVLVGRTVDKSFRRIARFDKTTPWQSTISHRRVSRPRRLTDGIEQGQGGVEMLELVRDGNVYRADETRDMVVEAGDRLLVSGAPSDIALLLQSTRARLATVIEDDQRTPMRSLEQMVVEAVVLPTSSCNGRLVSDLGLHHLYGVSVMGVQRYGRQQSEGLRNLRLSGGDMLLLQGTSSGLSAACEATNLLAVEGVEHSIARANKQWVALAIMAGVVIIASLTPIPIVTLSLAGALLMVVTGVLRPGEAAGSLDGPTLLLLAGTIPLGIAMEKTGLAQVTVDSLVGSIGVDQPWVFVSLFFLATWLLTELLSNNAVAVLLTPIAMSLAQTTGINHTALIMVVIFGASASFTLPQGYQTNAMVMGPGGYRFSDYVRFGLPLSLICWVTGSILIPLFWPLTP